MGWNGWNDENTAEAKRLFLDGKSATEIFEVIGAPTRNAVCGKLFRMGLTTSDKPHHTGKNPSQRAKAQPRPPRFAPTAPAAAAAALATPPQSAEQVHLPADLASLPRLADLPRHACRWPIGDFADGADQRFCGCARPANDDSYCASHREISGKPVSAGSRDLARSLRRYL